MELIYPSLLLPSALVFWGWQSDMLPAATAILVLIAFSRHTPWRWEMGIAEFHRVGDLTTLLLEFAIVYFYSIGGEISPVYSILGWLPVLSSPLLFGQMYSMGQHLPLSAVFYSMRRNAKAGNQPTVDFRLPYAFLCILAAGSGNPQDQSYYLGASVFILWVLWPFRSKRLSGAAWLGYFLFAVILGFGIQLGLGQVQSIFEEWVADWFLGWEPDPFRARTAIGDRGNLKLSSRVLLKVSASQPFKHTLLLKEAAYDRYSGQYWSASKPVFRPYTPPHEQGPYQINVLHLLARHDLLLALPWGVRGLEGPQEDDLSRNPLDTVKWVQAPPVVRYRIAFDPSAEDSSKPSAYDIQLPVPTREMLAPLAQTLGLSQLSPAQAVAHLGTFFAEHFAYSLDLGNSRDSDAALKDFLYRRRAGHCEYFATATALLLRAAAIPARYVVGFSVQEYDATEKAYLVRKRHAHAWTEAYVDGAWRTLDNTPSRWIEEEAKADPWWQPMEDVWSNWGIAFKIWQWERAQHPKQGLPWWAWLVVPLSAWLGWRLYRSRKRVSASRLRDAPDSLSNQPRDLDYARLEQNLLASGHPPRKTGETPLRWLRRLGLINYENEVLAYYRRRFGGK